MAIRIVDAEATLPPRMRLYRMNDFYLLFYLPKEGVYAAAFKVDIALLAPTWICLALSL